MIVGAGILGTMHAVAARRRDISVTHLEADPEPRGATVRNFGFIHVSARAPGAELNAALRSRSVWADLGAEIPGIGFRSDGSITVLAHSKELELASLVIEREDAAERGFKLLDRADVRAINPALDGDFLGGLHSTIDAVVEPRFALRAIREWLSASDRYTFLPATIAVDLEPSGIVDQRGRRHVGDHVILCPGVSNAGVAGAVVGDDDQYPVYLQMFQTEPHSFRLTTAVAGGDVMHDYPGFDMPSKPELPSRSEVGLLYDSHLLVTQRASGELTIGDTHHTDLPLPFDIDETPVTSLVAGVESILGTKLPPIHRRWSGVYGRTRTAELCLRRVIGDNATLVTGLGGRGMTISPAVAEHTFDILIGEGST